MEIELEKLRLAYELAKVRKRKENGKAFTDRDVARDYMTQNSSMISKVLNGTAKSDRVVKSLVSFIESVDPRLLK